MNAQFFGFAIVAIAVVAVISFGGEYLLRRRMRELAATRGATVDTARHPAPRGVGLRDERRATSAGPTIIGSDGATVSRINYRSGSNNRGPAANVLAIVPLSFNGPSATMKPPTVINKLGKRIRATDSELGEFGLSRAIGLVDMSIGHGRFDETFQLTTEDERFATRLLTREAANACVRYGVFDGHQVAFAVHGPWLLASGPHFELDRMLAFLDNTIRVAAAFPSELADDYPLPSVPRPFFAKR